VRQKSRIEATDSLGRALNVFLPRGTVLRGGDVLVCEDGSLVRVKAAPQPVLVVTHCADHGTPFDLLRAAYHLGNRHVPLELQPDRLLLEPDHVLADMLRLQHLIVTEASTAFEPEGGAYGASGGAHAGHAQAHAHAHDHGHAHAHANDHAHDHGQQDNGHDHGHDRKHDHAHARQDPGHDHGHAKPDPAHDKPRPAGKPIGIPIVGQAAPHVHGPDCDHDHGHDHGHGHDHPHGHGHGHKKHEH
jgi:urease accessory protein